MEMKRVAAVTGGLVVAGGIAGAVASMIAVGSVALVTEPRAIFWDAELFAVAGAFGAVYGAVLGPLAAWLLMRHVPLGLAIGGTMLGTIAGGVAALAFNGNVFILPLVGFAIAALVVRMAVPRPARVRVRVEG